MLKRARSKETLVEKNPAREKREMFVGGDPSNCYIGRSMVRRLFGEENRGEREGCGSMWSVFFFFFLRPNSRSRITSLPGRLTPARGRINKFRVGGT